MPAINPFVDSCAISTNPYPVFYHSTAGLKVPTLYKEPTPQLKGQVKQFCLALQAYDDNPTPENLAPLNALIQTLDLKTIRPIEEPDDVVFFYPTRNGDHTPFTVAAVLGWRFGKLKVNGDPSTYNNPVNNICHIEEHAGQDGTTYLGMDEFFKGQGKFCLISALNPHAVANPVKGQYIKYLSDPAHSNTTVFIPFMMELLQQMFPTMPVLITHGMDGAAHFKLLMGNVYNHRFLRQGQDSFATLFAIALAQQNWGPTPVVSVASDLPGFIVKNGQTMPVMTTPHKQGALRGPAPTMNTNVDGHIRNFSAAPLTNLGRQTDLAIHIESAPQVRAVKSWLRDAYIAALQLAIKWYREFDPAIQDPWKLQTRFPEVYANMMLYDTLFDPTFVANYKTAHAVQYAADTAAVATAASVVTADDDPGDIGPQESWDLDYGPDVVDDTPPAEAPPRETGPTLVPEPLPPPLLFIPAPVFGSLASAAAAVPASSTAAATLPAPTTGTVVSPLAAAPAASPTAATPDPASTTNQVPKKSSPVACCALM